MPFVLLFLTLGTTAKSATPATILVHRAGFTHESPMPTVCYLVLCVLHRPIKVGKCFVSSLQCQLVPSQCVKGQHIWNTWGLFHQTLQSTILILHSTTQMQSPRFHKKYACSLKICYGYSRKGKSIEVKQRVI